MNKILDRFLEDRDTTSLVAVCGAGILAGYWTLHYAWQRYRQRGARTDKDCSFNDSPLQAEILTLDLEEVSQALAQGRFTSVDLVHAYGYCEFDSEVCPEEEFEDAMAEAERMDSERKTLKKLP